MYYVYIITNLVNGKKYIGMSINKKKWFRKNYYGSGKLIKQAIVKYGKENFKKDIVKEFDDEYECRIYERYLIESINAVEDPTYYNMCPGGYGGASKGHIVTDETRKKISKAKKGKKHSEETRKIISEKVSGYKWKKEDIEKRSKSIQKYWDNISETDKRSRSEKISKSSLGKVLKDETREKLSKINSRLTKEQVIEICNLSQSKSYKEIGAIYGINESSIWAIVNRVSYKWVWN